MENEQAVVTFLGAVERLHSKVMKPGADNRFFVDMLDLVEAERDRIRGMPEPNWPDTLWHDYRIGLVLVQRHLPSVFDSFPERPSKQVMDRAIEVTGWLVALADAVRSVARGQVH